MADEIHIEKELQLALAEVPFGCKEAPLQSLLAEAPDRSEHLCAIAGQQRADFQQLPVVQAFGSGVGGSANGSLLHPPSIMWPTICAATTLMMVADGKIMA